MTTIPIRMGDNYISFPATSYYNFSYILTNSGLINNTLKFTRWDSILQKDEAIDYIYDYIEKGTGYHLFSTIDGNIIYDDGIEYTLTFDQLKSKLLPGWNLIGTGSNTIYQPHWCKIIDPMTEFPTTQIEPNKAYWINYYDCIQPTTDPILFISVVGLGLAVISLSISLKGRSPSPQDI